ncbi:exodeoxyribonuclease V subunit beta [Candidatus Hamiltonella defensa]|uniref:exodeoxyribonuclease V subunit beta n=1 Tax=Candidatus Williamhamiltonella defendens TaxID=138072 RepID=UPI00158166EA|nr:exodeoxyribonuclease V subunit beta [Candidatus Hamiltonella defensa]
MEFSMKKIQSLDPMILPLFGERLIEASAGTGKTFTIGILYLRLLLGLGGHHAYIRRLTVEEILVVTFTQSATEELRGRIRSEIYNLRMACLNEGTQNAFYQKLLAEITDLNAAASILLFAERNMDQAAIYTIHGFCQKTLLNNAFESGVLFKQTFIQNEDKLIRQTCADFWRRSCYLLSFEEAVAISQEWASPQALLKEISPYLEGEAPQLRNPPSEDESIQSRHQKIIKQITELKLKWQTTVPDLKTLIDKSGVDKRTYNSRYLPIWLEKITQWAYQESGSYFLPKELNRFRQSILFEKTQKGHPPQHPLFSLIDFIFFQGLTLRDVVLTKAIKEIRLSLEKEKRRRGELSFDDLLKNLDTALKQKGGNLLSETIRKQYPIVIIDEFQDTDPQQYRIFHSIYAKKKDCGLLLIGDPKQAIYAFRGADIFTYIRARSQIAHQYTLETNWRSSPAIVKAVNQLFTQIETPFLFSQIPFVEAIASDKNRTYQLTIDKKIQPALHFWLQKGEGITVNQYKKCMSHQCAIEIRDWLTAGQQGRAQLMSDQGVRSVKAADIAVLVRTRTEAALVKKALNRLSIPSVYMSNRDSVFDTPEAKDLLWILQAVLAPEIEKFLRCAMATSLLGLNTNALQALQSDGQAWDALVDEFHDYRQHWQKKGVLPMLRKLIFQRRLAENLLKTQEGERRLTDLLHLSELLQQISEELDSEQALVRWLAQKITEFNAESEDQKLRLETDCDLIQIVTVHQSKGLQYSLVWLPFIGYFQHQPHDERAQKEVFYHEPEHCTAVLDFKATHENRALAEKERLSEDLRLLYVALTRSVYHCSIGIAPFIKGGRKKQRESDIHLSALGYLIQKGMAGDAQYLSEKLKELEGEHIAVSLANPSDFSLWQPTKEPLPELTARHFTRKMQDHWQVTSYSKLQDSSSLTHSTVNRLKTDHILMQELLPSLDTEVITDVMNDPLFSSENSLSPHTFPRGAIPGTFLHDLLERLDFSQSIEIEWLKMQLLQKGFDEKWLPMLHDWLTEILDTPLNDKRDLSLSKLTEKNKQVELQFHLPIDAMLESSNLDVLIKKHDPLSALCSTLSFPKVQGILTGFIDLVFFWQDQFYLLDYKSNWLGTSAKAYHRQSIEQAMAEHRYDLQYQLYTLALHRYLRHRIPNYQYERDFGGVIYLFLRGVDSQTLGQGIFHCCPSFQLIEGLDQLFKGEKGGATE